MDERFYGHTYLKWILRNKCTPPLGGNLIEFGIISNIPIEGVHSYDLENVESSIRTLLSPGGLEKCANTWFQI